MTPRADDLRADIVDAVRAVATALADEAELDDLLHLIAARICALVDVRRCSIHLREEGGLFRGQVGHAKDDIDRDVKKLVTGLPADRFTLQMLQTRRPVLLSNAPADPRPIHSAMCEWPSRRSAASRA